LKGILEKGNGAMWTGFIWLSIGAVAGSCEHGNEPSGSLNVGKSLNSSATGGVSRTLLRGVSQSVSQSVRESMDS
jgi:hypothetical protein